MADTTSPDRQQRGHEARVAWDHYWSSKKSRALYDVIAEFYRRFIIRPTLTFFIRKHFPPRSSIVHAGCGSGQVDAKIRSHVKITALDISPNALEAYRRENGPGAQTILCSIFAIPLPDSSVDGVYNLGVMEHFNEAEIARILAEFKRLLKPGGKVVLFWPPEFGLSVLFFKALKLFFAVVLRNQNIKFHPDEICRLQSREHAERLLSKADLALLDYGFGFRDCFTYAIVVGQKLAGDATPKQQLAVSTNASATAERPETHATEAKLASTPTARWLVAAFPYLLVAFLIFARDPMTLARAEFWAEDLSEFLSEVMLHGARSLITPVWGYHFFVERVIAYGASFWPVIYAPFIYAGSSLGLNALAIGYFSRDGFAWIIPSRAQRIVVCALMTMGPGASEVFMNLCNLPTALSQLFALMLLERPAGVPFALSWQRLALLVFLLFSAGQAFIFAPIAALLAWRSQDKKYLLLLSAMALVVFLNAKGSQDAAAAGGLLNYGNLARVPLILVENFFERFLIIPLLGARLSDVFMHFSNWLFWPPTLIAASVVFWMTLPRTVSAIDQERFWLLLATAVCTLGIFGVIAVARASSIDFISRPLPGIWGMRYSFLPGMWATILWFTIALRGVKHSRPGTIEFLGTRFLVLLLASHFLWQFRNSNNRSSIDWPAQAAVIQEMLDRRERGELHEPVVIPDVRAHPSWTFDLKINP